MLDTTEQQLEQSLKLFQMIMQVIEEQFVLSGNIVLLEQQLLLIDPLELIQQAQD